MFYHPDLIVFLWLLPVVALLVLPAIFKTGCALYGRTSKSQSIAAAEYEKAFRLKAGAERRKHPRYIIKGVGAQLVDNIDLLAKPVNISKYGICLKNMSDKIFSETDTHKVVIQTPVNSFDMSIRQKWCCETGTGHLIGAEIENTSGEWEEFFSKNG